VGYGKAMMGFHMARRKIGDDPFAIRVAARPVALQVDPSFDLFRRLDPREIPASIGQIFGEPRLLAVLAADASVEEAAAWRALLESWRTDAHAVEIVTDAEVQELPADRAVWLLGRGNRLATRYFADAAIAGLAVDAEGLALDGTRLAFGGHTTVVVVRHPASAARAIGWLTVDPAQLAALPGLGRKLCPTSVPTFEFCSLASFWLVRTCG
jgi:aminopeptidase N